MCSAAVGLPTERRLNIQTPQVVPERNLQLRGNSHMEKLRAAHTCNMFWSSHNSEANTATLTHTHTHIFDRQSPGAGQVSTLGVRTLGINATWPWSSGASVQTNRPTVQRVRSIELRPPRDRTADRFCAAWVRARSRCGSGSGVSKARCPSAPPPHQGGGHGMRGWTARRGHAIPCPQWRCSTPTMSSSNGRGGASKPRRFEQA